MPLLNDIKKDKNSTIEEKEDNYIIKSVVNYPNNSELSYEKIYFDKDMNLEKVEVYTKEDIVKIKVDVKLDDLIDENCCNTEENNENCDNSTCENEKTEESSSIEDIIYPLYIPNETYLTSKDVLETEDSDRVILTYSGSKNFVLVEEKATSSNEFEIIPVYGDPLLLNDSVAALQANSVSWTSNNMEYYLAGNDLSTEELLSIATSLNNADIVTSQEIEK